MKKNKWFLNGGRGSGRTYRWLFEYYENKVANLEKENAELKNERNAFKIYSDGAELDAINLNEQLTKAKDHIKKLLSCLQQDTNDPQTNYYVVQYMTEAERFISEVVE